MSEKTTFHNEKAVLRIAAWTNAIAWVLLVLFMLRFSSDVSQIIANWPPQIPGGVFDRIVAYSGLFITPAIALFYFLLLRAVSEILYLGLDLFYGDVEDVEEIDVEGGEEK
jgi:hypothetical protein